MIETTPPMEVAIAILLVQFILPAGISLLVSEMMRKREWIKMGDLQLEL